MSIILTLTIIYLISVFLTWFYFKLIFSKYGNWSNLLPGITELMIMIIPLMNTFFLLAWIFNYPLKKHKKLFWNKLAIKIFK